MTDEDSVK